MAALKPGRWRLFLEQGLHRWTELHPLVIGFSCALVWPIMTWLIGLIPAFGHFYGVPLALAAVLIAAWAGGLTAGITTTALSALILYLILPSVRVVNAESEAAWHGVTFTLVAILMSGFEASLRNQHQRLQRDRTMRDEFLGIMSHELRTPITVIYGGVRLLRGRWQSLPADERDGLLLNMEEESERLSRMTEDLLSLSRLDLRSPGPGEPVQIGRIVSQGVDAFRRVTPERVVIADFGDCDILALGQEGYLNAIVRNLLSNADKYSPRASPIVVRVEEKHGNAFVAVRDYGPGISTGRLESIFEPYYRDPSLVDGTRGLGLGLTLCKRAIEAMKGKIWAEMADGDGLQVCFTLPLAVESAP